MFILKTAPLPDLRIFMLPMSVVGFVEGSWYSKAIYDGLAMKDHSIKLCYGHLFHFRSLIGLK